MRLGIVNFAALLVCAILVAPTVAQDKPAEKKPASAQDKPKSAGMNEWMKATMPGVGHKRLEPLVGNWKLTIKTVGDKPGEWLESSGTAAFKWAMEGRFLIEEVKTKLGDQPFEWMGLHGFDNAKKQYTSAWIDNLGTGIDHMTGTWDEAKRTITYSGDVDSPGGGSTKVQWIIKLEGPDKFAVEMFKTGKDGKAQKAMDVAASRIK